MVVTLDRAVWAQSLSQGTEFLTSTQAFQRGKGKAITVYVVGKHVHRAFYKERGDSSPHLERKQKKKESCSF